MDIEKYIPLVVEQVKKQLVGEQPDPNEVAALCIRAAVNTLPFMRPNPEPPAAAQPSAQDDIFSKYSLDANTDYGAPRRFDQAAYSLGLEAWQRLYAEGCFAFRHDWLDEQLLEQTGASGDPADQDEWVTLPRTAKCLGYAQWSWSCAHSRVEDYYLSRDRYFEYWRLFVVVPAEVREYIGVPYYVAASLPYKGVSPQKAALHLLAAYFSVLRDEQMIDSRCRFSAGDLLENSQIKLVLNYVWPDDPPDPILSYDRIQALLAEAYHERLRAGA